MLVSCELVDVAVELIPPSRLESGGLAFPCQIHARSAGRHRDTAGYLGKSIRVPAGERVTVQQSSMTTVLAVWESVQPPPYSSEVQQPTGPHPPERIIRRLA